MISTLFIYLFLVLYNMQNQSSFTSSGEICPLGNATYPLTVMYMLQTGVYLNQVTNFGVLLNLQIKIQIENIIRIFYVFWQPF